MCDFFDASGTPLQINDKVEWFTSKRYWQVGTVRAIESSRFRRWKKSNWIVDSKHVIFIEPLSGGGNVVRLQKSENVRKIQ